MVALPATGRVKTAHEARTPAAAAFGKRIGTPAALYAVFAVVHLALAWGMRNPVVHSDESGYLGAAHYLAHGAGLAHVTSQYHPAYALVLAPFSWLFDDPLSVYRAGLVFNSLALATVSVAAYALARYVLPVGRDDWRLLVAVVVGLYPPFLVFSNLAMAESLFIPTFMLTCLAIVRAFRLGSGLAWFAAGALAGFLYAIDPIGLVAIVAILLVALRSFRPTIPRVRAFLGLLLGLQATLAPAATLIRQVGDATTAGRLGTPLPSTATEQTTNRIAVNAGSVLEHFGGRLGDLLSELAGQAFYLTVSTYGVVVIGMVLAGTATWRVVRGSRMVADRLGAFVGVCMLATWLLSSVLIVSGSEATRPDSLIHGRYNEAVLAPVLVFGLAGLAMLASRRAARWQAWAFVIWGVIAVTGVGLRVGRSADALRGDVVGINVFGIAPVVNRLGGIDVVVLGLVAGAVGTLGVVLAKRAGLEAAAIPLAAVFGVMALFGADHLWADSRARADERVVADALGLIDSRFANAPGCIGYDLATPSDWHFFNYQLFRPNLEFQAFDSRAGQQPCSEIVITGRLDFGAVYPGARLMTPENHALQALWVMPGPLQDEIATLGWLVPTEFPGYLPDSALVSQIGLAGIEGEGRPVVTIGGRRILQMSVTHAGSGAPWPNLYGAKDSDGVVRLAAIWLAAGAPTVPIGESRVDLPRTLLPGQTAVVDLVLDPVDYDGNPLPPGRYLVWVTPVQEGLVHFFERGDRPFEVEVHLED